MAKIISLEKVRETRQARQSDPQYLAKLENMDKLGLLEEMIQFQEERSQCGALTLRLMTRGEILFQLLEQKAETHELRDLARMYRRHLRVELENYMKVQNDLAHSSPHPG